MRRKTKLMLIGATAVGVAAVLVINLTTPHGVSDQRDLRKSAPNGPPVSQSGR